MWDFVVNNLLGVLALIIMFCSLSMQFSYLKFKRKSVGSSGKIINILKGKFWQWAIIEFSTSDGQVHQAHSLCFNNKKIVGAETDILYNPKEIGKIDKSLMITPFLKKLGFKKETKFYVFMKQQNPSILHVSMIIFSLILLSFN